jgi:hypothetical protein
MPNKDEALLRILRQLKGTRVEEVADHILALFNEPQRWKPEDQQEVYRVSECGEIHASTFLLGEPRSESLWAFGDCFRTREDAARARDAMAHFLMTLHTQQP